MIHYDRAEVKQVKRDLKPIEIQQCYEEIAEGKTTLEENAAFLSAYNKKGITPNELASFVLAVRCGNKRLYLGDNIFDTCGTGGSSIPKPPVSTSVAFVGATLGVRVVKHAGRGSGGCGSLDILDVLGCPTELTYAEITRTFLRKGICFISAVHVNPFFSALYGARRIIRQPTIVNLIAPLANPVILSGRILGTPDAARARLLHETLRLLGEKRFFVVVGHGGIDEITLSGPSHVWGPDGMFSFNPKEIGIPYSRASMMPQTSAITHAQIIETLFRGLMRKSPLVDLIALNTGFLLMLAGKTQSYKDGYHVAKDCILSGKVQKMLDKYREIGR